MVNMQIVFSKLTIRLSGYYIDEVVLKQLLDGSLMVNMEIVFSKLPIRLSGEHIDEVVIKQLLDGSLMVNMEIVFSKLPIRLSGEHVDDVGDRLNGGGDRAPLPRVHPPVYQHRWCLATSNKKIYI